MRPALAATLALACCATPQPGAQHSLMPAFAATRAAQDSATAALGQWCAARALATPATIRAISVPGMPRAASATVRARLGVDAQEPLAYRHVRLACGARVLSDAQNWYVPARLTPEMNRLLESTDTPFGTVVAVIMSKASWMKLMPGYQVSAGDTPAPRGAFIQSGSLRHMPVSKKVMASDGHCR